MSEITCPTCGCAKIKKNGHIHNNKQNYMCLYPKCSRQFVLNPTKKYITDSERALIRKLLLERISLEGICRVCDVSMPWLLSFIETTYAQVPNDLNVVVNKDEIAQYSENLLNEKFIALAPKKDDLALQDIEVEIELFNNEEYILQENLNFDDAIENEIANQMEDAYTHEIVMDKNSVLFDVRPCEADEMWSFVDNKGNKQWIWLAINIFQQANHWFSYWRQKPRVSCCFME